MSKVLPLLLVLLLTGTGLGAGLFLRPDADPEEAMQDPPPTEEEPSSGSSAFARLGNQFVIPVLRDGKVQDLVVLALSVEVSQGSEDLVYSREPKLRDALLRVLFDHANAGGFSGEFTDTPLLDLLREHLRIAAREVIGASVIDVLIIELVRQEV